MHLPPSPVTGSRFRDSLRRRAVELLIAGIAALSVLSTPAAAAERAVVLTIDGAIGPAVADYVERELRTVKPGEVGLVILRMNTPGGLDTSMRRIISAILASPVPVATYVAPNGARAASAGTYIAYASAIAAMAPGTNIGAATPVQLGGSPLFPNGKPSEHSGQTKGQNEPADAESRKILNDAVAYIRGLANLHHRNADWAAEAVRNAASVPAPEALKLNVVDVIADDIPDLLRKIDGRTVVVGGKPERLATAGLDVVSQAPDWRTEFLAVITAPNIAFILLTVGVFGLIFEFFSPGMIAPGLVGAISLIVALYALNLLPINYAGVALVLLGIGLMVAEVHIGALGLVGLAGIAAFVIGAIMMFPAGVPGFALSPLVAMGVAVVIGGFFVLVLSMLLRSRKRAVITGEEGLIGSEGETVSWQDKEGRVRVNGEIWRARAARVLQSGSRIKVVDREGLVLIVEAA
jgi:membrane-bound serine protease (ClpP class)